MHPKYTRTLDGYTHLLIYGNEVQSGCKIIADGNSEANAVITVDFGQGACTSGKSVTLHEGSIFIGDANGDEHEVVLFGRPYRDIIFIMTDCNDEVTIAKTFNDTSSVEVLGYAGDDLVMLGDGSRPIDSLVFANTNIIVDGGRDHDIIRLNDRGSSTLKSIAVRATMVGGVYGSGDETISYFNVENIDVLLGTAAADVNVYSTARYTSLTLTTQDGDDVITTQNVQGPLRIDSGCGDDVIWIKQTKGDISLTSGAGLFSRTNLTIDDTLGGIDIDFGSAKRHTMLISNTRGDISIDTGLKVERSYISIEDTIGDIELEMGSGKFHNISLINTRGDVNLKFDLGDKAFYNYNTIGSVMANMGKGNDKVFMNKMSGQVAIESKDGSHDYKLHDMNGIADIVVGSSDDVNQFDLKDIDGSLSILTGDGDCNVTMTNGSGEFHLATGRGNRNILGKAMGSFKCVLGDGDDQISLSETVGAVSVLTGDGLHNLAFGMTTGSIDVSVGHAEGLGESQLFTINHTVGSVKLVAGKGDHRVVIKDTFDGAISVTADHGIGIFDILDTTNGDVSIISAGGSDNAITVANTENGTLFVGDVLVAIGAGSSTLAIGHISGDISVDMGPGDDVLDLFDIGGSIDVRTGAGNDLISVDKLLGNLLIDAGPGADVISIDSLGGNGTVLGGVGDDTLTLDPRGSSGNMNTMDGGYLSWNGGEGSDVVDVYFVSVGTIQLNFYNMEIDRVFGRCSDDGDSFAPSFSLGSKPQYMLDRLDGYLFIDVTDCCGAHFSYDAVCGDSDYGNPAGIWYYPHDAESTCYKKPLSEFAADDTGKYPTKVSSHTMNSASVLTALTILFVVFLQNTCCMEKFNSDVMACCYGGDGKCVSTSTPVYLPNLTYRTCQPRDGSLVPKWESSVVSYSIEECCEKCKCDENVLPNNVIVVPQSVFLSNSHFIPF